ncbi:apoptotic chromatin condensation inducer in the nucleus isoform X2 [Nematolebias whitei]|uniref:apoptotic chromatin condensation inducer in the nucleus isoform X2 n=1 Tax=Nematolebias whitei TaxID=451745 RepID=UPI00189BF066|nr:apoptotic chromatin condensation inducer in the nucleus isoform X2 [Nematolebias whitei]
MADLEDVTLDGRPLQSLRVADLKAALEERGLSKSGQKNALVKRLKGALMLENLQRTSTPHIGLQPNSQIGEEMSQNSFIKQYLAQQQELLRQRLEREAREAHETNDQQDHRDVNNSTSCPPAAQDVAPPVQHKLPGPSVGEELFGSVNAGQDNGNQEADVSSPPASASVAMRIPGGEQRSERGSASSEVAGDSDDEDSEGGDDDDDWGNNAPRRNLREPPRVPAARERSGAPRQPQQQHIPSLLSPQLRQPTPPPSPPPELSFPLPDTPKQSPPSPPAAAARHSPSSSSSGSSSSGSRSSSPEPQRSGHAERKPGPLTLLARKMESEGAFSGAGWHGTDGEGHRQDSSSPSAMLFPGRGAHDGLVSAVTVNTASHVSFPKISSAHQGVAPLQLPVSVLKATAAEERDREREAEMERERALELERQEKLRQVEQERAAEEERERSLALEQEERERALERERFELQQVLEKEKALQREQELALERERQERERALAKEQEERKKAMELERQRALEEERLQREREEKAKREREEMERAMELERAKALELERLEKEKALEQERLEREQALEAERREKERIEREKVLEQERLEKERIEREKVLEQERLEKERLAREKALEQERLEKERIEREKALEQERLEKERIEREKVLEQERLKKERLEKEKALEQERLEKERLEREKALEQERLEKERLEREKVLEQERQEKERLEREKVLEQERLEKERLEREKVLEQERLKKERIDREKALEQERLEKERIEREKALEQERLEKERIEREKALEQERERIRREKALEQERLEKKRIEREKALEQARLEKERIKREKALEQERLEKERIEREKTLEQERLEKVRIEREKALEQERKDRERRERGKMEKLEREATLEREKMEKEKAEKEKKEQMEREKTLEQEKRDKAKTLEKERKEKERTLELEKGSALEQQRLEKKKAKQKEEERERALEEDKEKSNIAEKNKGVLPLSKCGREVPPQPTPSPLSKKTTHKSSTEPGQEHVYDPVSQTKVHTAESDKIPLSPHSSFKKFRFFRDSPIHPKSSTSLVIKRPRTFSDSPQSQTSHVTSPTCVGERGSSTKQEEPQIGTNQEVGAATVRPTEAQSKKITETLAQDQSPTEERAKGFVLENNQKASPQMEASFKEFIKSSKELEESKESPGPVDGSEQREQDSKKPEKLARQRSSSNESSSSESDSGSSSSQSSGSSTSSQDKTSSSSRGREKLVAEGPSRVDLSKKRKRSEREEEQEKQRQVTDAVVTDPQKLSGTSEEVSKVFSARKISLGSSKSSPGSGEGDQESVPVAGRKRRWGSSTAVTAKKPSISITTDSLKSLIPDIKPALGQEAVMDLHPEEAALSGAEDEEQECSDQNLQIRRTVTQVIHAEENGQQEAKRSRCEEFEEEDSHLEQESIKVHEEQMDTSVPGALETQSPTPTSQDVEISTVTLSEPLIRRSISQQKTGVYITVDDPVRTSRQPSPPRGKASSIVHVCNLVRPFTLGQLKELLSRTGSLVEDGFWIDKIKSHCYVTYSCMEEAVATRVALHGVKWPQSNPKVLRVDFCEQDELDFHKGLIIADKPGGEEMGPASGHVRTLGLPPLMPERYLWSEREREMERRERAREEREWDRDKIREFRKPGEEKDGGPRRSRSRERRRKERGKSKEKKTEKKAEDPPAKLLDDLFCKTKATPCIYWLPLTEEQFLQREADRAERRKQREKIRKEQEEEEAKKMEEERKERMKVAGATTGDRSEGEKEKDRERDRGRDGDRDRNRDRDRERENDKRRDAYRRPGGSSARRSRSRSDPRERRH